MSNIVAGQETPVLPIFPSYLSFSVVQPDKLEVY
jgi:hypothetical protein